jgi:hypothetical protein
VRERLYLTLTARFVRGCSENAGADSAALVREITASTEPRMSKSGPLRTERVGHSLTFVALCCGVWANGPFSSFGDERSAGHGEICEASSGAAGRTQKCRISNWSSSYSRLEIR